MKKILFGLLLLCVTTCGSYLVFKKGSNPFSKKKLSASVADNKVYPAVCRAAALDAEVFKNFKRSPYFNLIEEYTTFEEGKEYLDLICARSSYVLDKLDVFRKNDTHGNPRVFDYGSVGKFSPTTLRQMKIAADLSSEFGDLSQFDIVEIGGGYGGQCFAISALSGFKSYTIVDLPECLELAKTYLEKQGIQNVRFCPIAELSKLDTSDLVLSHYAFSESDKSRQQTYIDQICSKAKRGFFVCDTVPKHFRVRPYSQKVLLSKLRAAKLSCELKTEEPLITQGNFLVTWHPHQN